MMTFTGMTLSERVYPILAAIPSGRVATYGDIAHLAGSPRAARQIGAILRHLPSRSSLPWHRVVNRQGRISLTGDRYGDQKKLLLAEGILFNAQDIIDLQQYRWCL